MRKVQLLRLATGTGQSCFRDCLLAGWEGQREGEAEEGAFITPRHSCVGVVVAVL